MLYIVPTPLGNLNDISHRARTVLEECDFVIAENPSQTHKLFQLLKLAKKEVVQLADHNEKVITDKLVARLKNEVACLVSDAGTPTISDPGFKLVRACREDKVEVISLPGPNAAITALAGSGLPTDKFIFVGFLPKTEPKLINIVEECKNIEATLVAYESPQRITKTVSSLNKHFPDAKICIARELTKMHEEYINGSTNEVLEILNSRQSIKGEITLLISFK